MEKLSTESVTESDDFLFKINLLWDQIIQNIEMAENWCF